MPSYCNQTADDLYLLTSNPDELIALTGIQVIINFIEDAFSLKYNAYLNKQEQTDYSSIDYMKWLHVNSLVIGKYYEDINNHKKHENNENNNDYHSNVDNMIKIMKDVNMNPADSNAIRFFKTIGIDDDYSNDTMLKTMMNMNDDTISLLTDYTIKTIIADRTRRDKHKKTYNINSITVKANLMSLAYNMKTNADKLVYNKPYYSDICKMVLSYPTDSIMASLCLTDGYFNEPVSDDFRLSLMNMTYNNSKEQADGILSSYGITRNAIKMDSMINGLKAYDVIFEIMSTAVNYRILLVEPFKAQILRSLTLYNALQLQIKGRMNNVFTMFCEQYADMMKRGARANDSSVMQLSSALIDKAIKAGDDIDKI